MSSLTGGERLEDAIKARGLDKKDVADALHKSPSAISAWTNNVSKPRPKDCDALADLLGIDHNEVRSWFGRPLLKELTRRAIRPEDVDDVDLDDPFVHFWLANSDQWSEEQKRMLMELGLEIIRSKQ